MRFEEIVVVGAGPGGCAAAVQCKRLGIAPVLLDRSGEPGGLIANAFLVENYPGLEFPVKGKKFCSLLAKHLERFQISVDPSSVIRVSEGEKGWLVETDRELLTARNVILCTGTIPRRVQIQKRDGSAIVYNEVKPFLDENPVCELVLIVGGGEAAFDYALSVAETGARVSILVRGSYESVRGRLAEMVAGRDSVRVERKTSLVDVQPSEEGGLVAVLESADGREERRVSGVIAAVGREGTATKIVAGLKSEGLQAPLTQSEGLFICGDARLGSLGQAGIAVGDGLAAAAIAVENTVRAVEAIK